MSTRLVPSAQADHFVHDRLPPPEQWPELRFDRPELQLPAQVNAVQALFERATQAGHADRPLFRSDERTLSYAQAQAEVNRIANALTVEFGLVPGNRVLLRGGNSVAMALAWLGTVQAGLVAVATMPLLRAKELGAVIAKAQPSVALCDVKLQDELKTALAADPASAGMTLLVFNTGGADVPHSLEALAARQSGHSAPCPTAANDIALLAFTSGTTGTPKAAVHTHRDVLVACETWPAPRAARHARRHRRGLAAAGLHLRPGRPAGVPHVGRRLGVLSVHSLHARGHGAADRPRGRDHLLHRAHLLPPDGHVRAAARHRPAAHQRERGRRPARCHAPALERRQRAGDARRHRRHRDVPHLHLVAAEAVRRGAIGQVVPGYEARVVDDDGQPLPIGEVGKLAVIGPTGCKYLDEPRQTQYVKAGWNFPGDAFRQDADGYFFYQARTDDMIITAGYNVAGPEVEASLLQHPAVAECGVVGCPDEERGRSCWPMWCSSPARPPTPRR